MVYPCPEYEPYRFGGDPGGVRGEGIAAEGSEDLFVCALGGGAVPADLSGVFLPAFFVAGSAAE